MSRHVRNALETLSTVLVIAAASALLWTLYQTRTGAKTAPQVESVENLTIAPIGIRHVRGDGRFVLVEFSDFECPFCARHARTTATEVEERFLESGQVRHVFLNFPLTGIHHNAQKAAEAAECAARQGRFWQMHEELFAKSPNLGRADLISSASAIGLNEAEFGACLDSGQGAPAVSDDIARGSLLGVESTPTFFVGIAEPDGSISLRKRIRGAAPFDAFATAIEDLTTVATPRQSRRSWWVAW